MSDQSTFEKLSQPFDDVKWRLQSGNVNSRWGRCVAYIDSRQVMDRLDEVVGPENWCDQYHKEGDKWLCGISLRINDEWITKWDTGDESNTEGNKGQVSDSFKRAAVKWGIGRDLYAKDLVFVKVRPNKNNKPEIYDENKKTVYDVTTFINSGQYKNVKNNKQSQQNTAQQSQTGAQKKFDPNLPQHMAMVEKGVQSGMSSQKIMDGITRKYNLTFDDNAKQAVKNEVKKHQADFENGEEIAAAVKDEF